MFTFPGSLFCSIRAANGQIRIADGFDLLQAKLLTDFIKGTEIAVDFGDQFVRREFFTELSESDKIREQDGHVFVPARVSLAVLLQLISSIFRKNIQEQLLTPPFFAAGLVEGGATEPSCRRHRAIEKARVFWRWFGGS